MKAFHALIAFLSLSLPAVAEDFLCAAPGGCAASNVVGGQLVHADFRPGDCVSTDAGWSVSTDDGWVKIHYRGRGNGLRPQPGDRPGYHPTDAWGRPLIGFSVYQYVTPTVVVPLGVQRRVPHDVATFGILVDISQL